MAYKDFQKNTFEGGLSKDLSKEAVVSNKYLESLNLRRISKGNRTGAKETVLGNNKDIILVDNGGYVRFNDLPIGEAIKEFTIIITKYNAATSKEYKIVLATLGFGPVSANVLWDDFRNAWDNLNVPEDIDNDFTRVDIGAPEETQSCIQIKDSNFKFYIDIEFDSSVTTFIPVDIVQPQSKEDFRFIGFLNLKDETLCFSTNGVKKDVYGTMTIIDQPNPGDHYKVKTFQGAELVRVADTVWNIGSDVKETAVNIAADLISVGINAVAIDNIVEIFEDSLIALEFASSNNIVAKLQIGNEIGLRDLDGIYNQVVISRELNFSQDRLIRGDSRIRLGNQRVWYFTDFNNPLRFVNIDDENWNFQPLGAFLGQKFTAGQIKANSGIESIMNLLLKTQKPRITYEGYQIGGSVLSGAYVYAVRYLTANLEQSIFLETTNPVPVVQDADADADFFSTVMSYNGVKDNTETNKSIKLKISNLDDNFKFIEVAACKMLPDNTEIFDCKIIGRFDIEGLGEIDILHTGDEAGETLDQTEIQQRFAPIDTAKDIKIIKDRLFPANIKLQETSLDWDLSGVTIEFVTKEHAERITDGPTDLENFYFIGGDKEINDYFERGYMCDESYALAIVAHDSNGLPLFAIPFGDGSTNSFGLPLIKIPKPKGMNDLGFTEIFEGDTDDDSEGYKSIGLLIKGIVVPDDVKAKISGFGIWRADRDDANKTVLGQGLLNPTITNTGGVLPIFFQAPPSSLTSDLELFTFDSPEFQFNEFTGYLSGDKLNTYHDYNFATSLLKQSGDIQITLFSFGSPIITSDKETVNDIADAKTVAADGAEPFDIPANFLNNNRVSANKSTVGTKTVGVLFGSDIAIPGYSTSSRRLLAAYIRPNPAQYGRPENIVYYPTGHFFPISSDSPSDIPDQEVFGGDTFINDHYYKKFFTDADSPSDALGEFYKFPIQSTINIQFRRSLTDEEADPPGVNKLYYPGDLQILSILSFAENDQDNGYFYNKAYSGINTLKQAVTAVGLPDEVIEHPVRTYSSNADIAGSLSDSLRVILPNNFQEKYYEWGQITALEKLNNDLIAFHDSGHRRLNINREEIIQSEESFKLLIGTGSVLGRESTVLSNRYGCSNMNAIYRKSGWIYFYDSQSKKILRTNGKNYEEISAKDIMSDIREAKTRHLKNRDEAIYVVGDHRYDEIIFMINQPSYTIRLYNDGGNLFVDFIKDERPNLPEEMNFDDTIEIVSAPTGFESFLGKFPILDIISRTTIKLKEGVGAIDVEAKIQFADSVTFSFSEIFENWEGDYSFQPYIIYADKNRILSAHESEGKQLWLHDYGKLYNNFYGVQFNGELVFCINKNFDITKVFGNHKIDVNAKWKLVEYESNALINVNDIAKIFSSSIDLAINDTWKPRGSRFQSPIPRDAEKGAKVRADQLKIKLITDSNEFREIFSSFVFYNHSLKTR